jgi:N-acetylglucosaminyl-diphospho-decaprenol L-rhamnosyltransferase
MSIRSVGSNPASAQTNFAAPDPSVTRLDIAVIIVTYKSAQLTIEALRSLLTERESAELRIRAVVVDNASGDLPEIANQVELYEWSSWVTLVLAPNNGGFACGNNLGIESAYAVGTPSYVYLLNPDAQVRPGAISSLVHFLDARPDVGIAGSSFETLDGNIWPIAFRFPTLISELNQGLDLGIATRLLDPWVTVRYMARSNEQVDWISGASVMIRPEVLAAIGGLDENYFLYFEETDFCRRARAAGFPTWYVPESRVMHIGGHSTAVTDRTRRRMPAYWFESRRRYFVVSFGLVHAMAIDAVAVIAHSLGILKRIILRRQHTATPYFVRDLVRHSVIWKRNRNIPPAKSRLAPRSNV